MRTVNHQTWEKIVRLNKKVAWITIITILMGMMSMLAVSACQEVKVYYNGTCQTVVAYSENPVSILDELGIDPKTNEYEMEYTAKGWALRVSALLCHTLTVDGQTIAFEKRTDSIANMLQDHAITLGEWDTVTPSLNTVVTKGTAIVVDRVEYQLRTVEEAVQPTVVYEDTDSLPLGTQEVKLAGASGSQLATYQQRLVNGKVVETILQNAVPLKAAKDRVVLRGVGDPKEFAPVVTNNKEINNRLVSPLLMDSAITVDKNGRPTQYKQRINGLATAYYEGPNGITATGAPAQLGYVAVDPNEIPYGTKMYICTADGSYMYGVAVAADTGGFTSGPVDVDLYFSSEAACIQFGVRDVEIYIL